MKLLNAFRIVAIIEGISFLLLLGIAMPLKYFYDMPEAVKIAGWAHGVLFVAYLGLLYPIWTIFEWSGKRVGLAVAAALLPAGPFFMDRGLKAEITKAGNG